MRIKAVNKNGKNYSIILDEIDEIYILPIIYEKYYIDLQPGHDISREKLDQILFDHQYEIGLSKVFSLLSRQYYSEKEIILKLNKKQLSHEVIHTLIDYLKEKKYLNDSKFLYEWAQIKVNNYFWGPKKLRFKLQKRLDDPILLNDIIDRVYSLYDPVQLIQSLIAKKKSNVDLSDFKERSKVYRFLANNGFASQTIYTYFEIL